MDDMKRELVAVKNDIEDLRSVNRRIIATLVRLEGKFDDMVERMATKDHFEVLIHRMDGFAGQLEDSRFRWAAHADTLVSHDKRLRKLEARRS